MASAESRTAGIPRRLHGVPLQLDTGRYVAAKDPCPVLIDGVWHLFGTGALEGHRYEILHAVADHPALRWLMLPPSELPALPGACSAAPGMIADGRRLHMFLQTEYNRPGGVVEHLVSDDGGTTFRHSDTALVSLPRSGEAGIYDPHPALINGRPYLLYSGFDRVGRPDLYLAGSAGGRWDGPWQRRGAVLRHEQVSCHNQHDDPAYEWGLEGGQLIELPDGRILLNAVCFLPGEPPGARQRVFFAVADRPEGPYQVLGPILQPERGEIGHAAVVIHRNVLHLFYQARLPGGPWTYGLATAPLASSVRPEFEERRAA